MRFKLSELQDINLLAQGEKVKNVRKIAVTINFVLETRFHTLQCDLLFIEGHVFERSSL